MLAATIVSWNVKVRTGNLRLDISYLPLIVAISFEVIQLLGITDGTYDPGDILAACLGFCVAGHLSRETGESVIFSKRLGDAVVYLNVLESTQTVRYSAAAGDLKPMHSTSSGKALIGALGESERTQLIARLRGSGPGGARLPASQRAQLVEEIKLGSRRGWYVGRGENVMDVMGVAAPVYVAGEVFAIAVAGPMVRLEPKLHAHAKQLVWICKALLKK